LKYLMTTKVFDGVSGSSVCGPKCGTGWTTNGNKKLICQKCDATCATCEDDANVGDKKKCKTCAPATPFLFSKLSECTEKCADGRYQIQESRCYECDPLCASCVGNQRNCTKCEPNEPDAFLSTMKNEGDQYERGTCVSVCVIGYFYDRSNMLDQKCGKCQSPCTACQDDQDNCLACDGTLNRWYQWKGKCFEDCPPKTAASIDT